MSDRSITEMWELGFICMLPTKKLCCHTDAFKSVLGGALERREGGKTWLTITSIVLPLHIPKLTAALTCIKLKDRGLLE